MSDVLSDQTTSRSDSPDPAEQVREEQGRGDFTRMDTMANPTHSPTASTVEADRPLVQPKDGDVFRFMYSEESWQRAKKSMGGGDLNWCFDGQLIYRNGLLCDTYWGLSWGGDNGRYFRLADALAKGELTYVCNLNDVEKIREDEYPLYAESDAFNLSHNHGCHRYFVKRRGVRKDAERMRAAVYKKIQSARADVTRAISTLEYEVSRRDALLAKIDAGEEAWI